MFYVLNTFVFYSPLMLIFALIRSKLSNLCKYHRFAIISPIIGFISVFINDYIYQISDWFTYITIFT